MYAPKLISRKCGGWLAMSPPDSALKIAVTSDTEEGAKESFQRAMIDWERLLQLSPPAPEESTHDQA